MTQSRFVVRKVKDGSVKIGNKIYKPASYDPYDGRLDGFKCQFYTYDDVNFMGGVYYIYFIGTVKYLDELEYSMKLHNLVPVPDPENLIDGVYHWQFWYTEKE